MDLNLDTLKREILDYLEEAGFRRFPQQPGQPGRRSRWCCGTPRTIPTTRCFWTWRSKTGVKLILFATREFEADDIDELIEQLDELRIWRATSSANTSPACATCGRYEGVPARSNWPSTTTQRLYVYELQPDWYEEFLTSKKRSSAQPGRRRSRRRRFRSAGISPRTDAMAAPLASCPIPMPQRVAGARCRAADRHARGARCWCIAASPIPPRRAASSARRSTICTIRCSCATCRPRSSASRAPSASGEKILIYGDYDVDGTTSRRAAHQGHRTGRRRRRATTCRTA